LRSLFLLAALLASIALARVWVLAVAQGDFWLDRAEGNFLQPRAIDPPRGLILDRQGEPLAINLPVFDFGISRYRHTSDEIRAALAEIRRLVPGRTIPSDAEVMAVRPAWREKRLLTGLEPEEALPLLEAMGQWDFIRAYRRHRRHYPLGRAAAHVVGYLRGIPPERLDEFQEKGYRRDDLVGWTGVERAWEESLRGNLGEEKRERDALDRELSVELARAAVPGANLYLALDARVQRAASEALQGRRGAAVALDPKTGGILAMASEPAFDPNTRVLLSGDSEFNRALRSPLAPASSFKIFSAVAMLEAGVPKDGRYHCGGAYYLPNWSKAFHCGHREGHGWINLRDMLKTSCNIYIYRGAREVGASRLIEVFDRFGFGKPTGLAAEGFQESSGALPAPGTMLPGEVILAGIGQGRIAATPIQMAAAVGAFANGGAWREPHFAERVENLSGEILWQRQPTSHRIQLLPSHRAKIIEGMRAVCQERGGTAFAAKFDPAWDAAGKTGSAQRKTISDAWFAGFAPARAPEIVVVVRVEEAGGGGTEAGPIARAMLAAWFGEE
jgi:penicillin-binding protein 2